MTRTWTLALGVVWIGALALGVGAMATYAYTPGEAGKAPARWPEASAVERVAGRPTLLLFAHPRCPCTRATFGELARIVTRAPALDVRVLFSRPAGAPEGWERSDTWTVAKTLPGATVAVDVDGVEARRFGAATSGAALLYDAAGRLAFSGGITHARGEAGDSAGESAILALVAGAPAAASRGDAPPATAPVFGCALEEAGAAPAGGCPSCRR